MVVENDFVEIDVGLVVGMEIWEDLVVSPVELKPVSDGETGFVR